MRRLGVCSFVLLTVLSAGCGSSTTSTPQNVPTSAPTFAIAEPLIHPALAHVDGAPIVAARTTHFRVFEAPWSTDRVRRFSSVNDWGQRLWLPVIKERVVARDPWFLVRLAERPNGSTGWVRAEDVATGAVQDRIVVRLRRHTLTRYDDGDMVERYKVAIGKPSTPTTPGRFFVWARVGYEDTNGPYGNFALGLSGFSNVITDWPGGGRMAIHGTSDPNLAGENVSNGCIRVSNPLMATLVDVPMGATVIIRR